MLLRQPDGLCSQPLPAMGRLDVQVVDEAAAVGFRIAEGDQADARPVLHDAHDAVGVARAVGLADELAAERLVVQLGDLLRGLLRRADLPQIGLHQPGEQRPVAAPCEGKGIQVKHKAPRSYQIKRETACAALPL